MTKLLEQAIERIRELPEPVQDRMAAFILEYAAQSDAGEHYQLSEEQLVELDRRLAEKDPEVLTMDELRARLHSSGIL